MGNTSVNNSDKVVYLCDEIFDFATISGVFFILIFIFSVAGNGLLLCVLLFYENLKNATNLFVLNLACSDLVFTVTLPFWATQMLHHWVFGDICCKLMTAAYFVGLYSSIILLTAITLDRFITVVLKYWPSNQVRRQRFAMVACAAAWVISIAGSLSDAVKVKAEKHNIPVTCGPPSDDPDVKLGYYLQVSLLFFLPFFIIVLCYSAILKTVLQSSNRKKHRTVVVVLCIVAAFFICWGPYNVMLFILPFYEHISCNAQERLMIAYHICQILAFSHCCMNPLLYMLSQKLREHLLHLFSCEKVRRKNSGRVTGQWTVIQRATSVTQNSADMLELRSL
ncbi:chemokine XC receptor 1-like [Xiphias gladius]|uniref:chemokine XC receptor 1-like n=1 Tax=Xiphias gladius TaxID=8245 RepID=UPI001A98680E|nr:chemokine XC receptor 1-like [Xiphias gladius]